MTLFFATVAVGPGPVLSELKAGALLTVTGGALALAGAWVLSVGRFARRACVPDVLPTNAAFSVVTAPVQSVAQDLGSRSLCLD
jgi:hypothetical protein